MALQLRAPSAQTHMLLLLPGCPPEEDYSRAGAQHSLGDKQRKVGSRAAVAAALEQLQEEEGHEEDCQLCHLQAETWN